MLVPNQNSIGRSAFNFLYGNKTSASRCNRLIESIFHTQILPELEKAISASVPDGLYIEIPKLDINIGRINEKEISASLAARIGDSLETALKNKIVFGSETSGDILASPEKSSVSYLLEILEFFLTKGFFPSGFGKLFPPGQLIAKIIAQDRAGFAILLKKYRYSDSVVKRLTYNTNPETFDKLVHLLTPVDFSWVSGFRNLILKAKQAANIRNVSETELLRILNFLILKGLLNQNGNVLNRMNFAEAVLSGLLPAFGTGKDLFTQHFKIEAENESFLVFTGNNPSETDTKNSEQQTDPNKITIPVTRLSDLINSGEKSMAEFGQRQLAAALLQAVQNPEEREFLVENTNQTGAIFLLRWLAGINATGLVQLVTSFSARVMNRGQFTTVNKLKNKYFLNHLALDLILCFKDNSNPKITMEELMLFMVHSSGVETAKLLNSEVFSDFLTKEKRVSATKFQELIRNNYPLSKISEFKKTVSGNTDLASITIAPDIRLTEEFILSSKRKIIAAYLESGFLPDRFIDLNHPDLQSLFADLLQLKDSFLAEQLKTNGNDALFVQRFNLLVTDQVIPQLEAYLIHFFNSEHKRLTRFLNDAQAFFKVPNPEKITTRKFIVPVFLSALMQSSGGADFETFIYSVFEFLHQETELESTKTDYTGFIQTFVAENKTEKTGPEKKVSDSGLKRHIQKNLNQLLQARNSVDFETAAVHTEFKNRAKNLYFHFETNRPDVTEILQKNEKQLFQVLAVLNIYLSKQEWERFNKSLLTIDGLRHKTEIFNQRISEFYNEVKTRDLLIPGNPVKPGYSENSPVNKSIGDTQKNREETAVILNLILTDKQIFENFAEAIVESGLPEYFRFENKDTQTILYDLWRYYPSSLTGKINAESWKKMVLHLAVETLCDSAHTSPKAFVQRLLKHLVKKLRKSGLEDFFFPVFADLQSSGSKDLQFFLTAWPSGETSAPIEKNTRISVKKNDEEKIHQFNSYLKFYAENGFFPWWAGTVSFPEIISELNKIRSLSKTKLALLEKVFEGDLSYYKNLLEKMPINVAPEFIHLFRGSARLTKTGEKITRGSSAIKQKLPQDDNSFQKEIYFLSEAEILKHLKFSDSKITHQINEYLRLAPWFYFREINPAKWRKLVLDYALKYYQSKDASFENRFHSAFLTHLKQQFPLVNWKETFTKLFLLVKKTNPGPAISFPKAMLDELNISPGKFSSGNSENTVSTSDEGTMVKIGNSGLILFWPFLTRLFEKLEMVKNGNFVDDVSRNRAVYLLQYLVFNEINFPEYQLVLNKLLTGIPTGHHLEPVEKLSDQEIELAISLLNGLINNWDKVKNSTPEGIQETFLQREGILTFKTDHVLLKVEKKGVDVLMQSIPWNISTIKLSWMQFPVHVEWI